MTQLYNVELNGITIQICQQCFPILQGYQGSDPTMTIFYSWSEECGPPPPLPHSLSQGCDSGAELAYYFDMELNGRIRKSNPNFPMILTSPTEKLNFLTWLKQDWKISNILNDVTDEDHRKNILLRLWVGLKDAAKTIRKDYNTAQMDRQGKPITKDYTPDDRTSDFTFTVDPKASKDVIYANSVEAAPYHELQKMHHEQVYLQGVPLTSRVWKYIKYKGKCIVTLSDIEDQCKV